ncbi:aldo/keto reductase [Rhizorhabdus dicambivorans]|uniref:Aldo/keto reductase n=1 Tax=Rhizorhabdus dicambivorans TaxID=1850238 RepID=A0A2A4G1X2_9SPHN|nr:aldo/keto reductase [Rhizorhabdus dicambivorans]ATE66735.1 aldo/keto reductase [Rhizorhabdus dicambivorans]PCE43777.1 aldo/keto reductase [Rhizorhabdus dicambivorans]
MPELRKLGSTGLSVAPLVVGGNVFGWTIDEATSFAVLDAFVDAGATMIDTADVYYAFAPGNVGGESETIIGKWMKARGNRADVQIATKVGLLAIDGDKGLKPSIIIAGIEQSLRRLQTDYIDLYYAHFDDDCATQEAVAEAFDGLVRAGKVRALGASNFSQDRLASALALSEAKGLARYGALQQQFNLMAEDSFPADYRAFCIEQQVGGLAYFGLASGFLTGKYRSAGQVAGSRREHSLKHFFTPRGDAVLAALDGIAAETGTTQAQIALAWIFATPGLTGALASATSVAQVESLIPAMELALDAEQMRRLNEAAATPS